MEHGFGVAGMNLLVSGDGIMTAGTCAPDGRKDNF